MSGACDTVTADQGQQYRAANRPGFTGAFPESAKRLRRASRNWAYSRICHIAGSCYQNEAITANNALYCSVLLCVVIYRIHRIILD